MRPMGRLKCVGLLFKPECFIRERDDRYHVVVC
jgi:hypothetical protein